MNEDDLFPAYLSSLGSPETYYTSWMKPSPPDPYEYQYAPFNTFAGEVTSELMTLGNSHHHWGINMVANLVGNKCKLCWPVDPYAPNPKLTVEMVKSPRLCQMTQEKEGTGYIRVVAQFIGSFHAQFYVSQHTVPMPYTIEQLVVRNFNEHFMQHPMSGDLKATLKAFTSKQSFAPKQSLHQYYPELAPSQSFFNEPLWGGTTDPHLIDPYVMQKYGMKPSVPNGKTIVSSLAKLVPALQSGGHSCPACDYSMGGTTWVLQQLIQHLNDDSHCWSREQIAEWLENSDIEIAFQSPEDISAPVG